MEYKETLLMPKTEFKMRGNLPVNEEIMRAKWKDLYYKILEKNKDKKLFVLHDGPPYANGDIHIGHALNKILKDFINRYKMLTGYNVYYIPGFDVHGLPIETAVTKKGINRKKLSVSDFRKLCEDFANEQIDIQKNQFQLLNVIGDWDNPYITMTKEYEARQIEVFAKMAKKGLIYKGLKPVYWSPSSETALAEAEIEYKDHQDPSIYVCFPVLKGNDYIFKDDFLVIWTTTPWTLPGNLAIAVNELYSYVRVLVNDQYYIVAKDLLDDLVSVFNWSNYEIVSTFEGKDLVNVKYKHIFNNKELPIVLGDHVALESGTGLVHTAPGYGMEDFEVGLKYNLGIVQGIDEMGVLNEESLEFAGMYFEEANLKIIERAKELGFMLKVDSITHSYPHDWRTKKPVIFRATSQWFCSIEKIRDKLLDTIENDISWLPKWGQVRLYNMIKDRADWCISRQRVWGVPIPIFYNEDGSPILEYDVMMHISKLFRKYGSNIWFEKSATELLPDGYTNELSPNNKFTKETDIMDVWFDSGSSHTGTLIERDLPYPADIYLEGSDQYRGWFNSSLICGVAAHGKSPYKQIISHGFVLDGKGQKMSKSLGNVVDPIKIIKKDGTDILRLMIASVDYKEDVKISNELMLQVKENYRKIRNTYRFMLGNLFDYNLEDEISFNDLVPYNKFMLIKLNEIVKEVRNAYDNYHFQDVYKIINNFINYYLSSFYLDFTKDILYIEGADSFKRRSVQTVLYRCLDTLIKLLAPILPYTSEEVYQLLPNKLESVHLDEIPEIKDLPIDLLEEGIKFFEVKDAVYKALEEARNLKLIGKGLEAKVYINLNGIKIDSFKDNLRLLLIVSEVELTDDKLPMFDNVGVSVEVFKGKKCERCWNYFKDEDMVNDICDRCSNVINS